MPEASGCEKLVGYAAGGWTPATDPRRRAWVAGSARGARGLGLCALLLLAMIPGVAAAAVPGTISTFAGNPTGSGPAIGVGQRPQAVVVSPDGSSLYIADAWTNSVRKVNAAGHETTVAGNGIGGFSDDGGPATAAELNDPLGLAVDSGGDLLISDVRNNRVRLVAAADCASGCPYGLAATTKGDIYTIAGNGTSGFSGDGLRATFAQLNTPVGLAVDGGGNLLISDTSNNRVRLVAAADCGSGCPYGLAATTKGDIYTIAGNGPSGAGGFSGDGGAATAAKLFNPGGVAVDSAGDVLISDSFNNRVRLVAAADCASDCPYALAATTKGDIYTIAGNGTSTFIPGDGGPATAAWLGSPQELAIDSVGDVVILAGVVRLVAANDCASRCPFGLAATTKGDIYRIAGSYGATGFSGDGGPATAALLNGADGVAVDGGGDVLIGDSFNNRMRLVAAADCASGCPYALTVTTKGDIYTIAGNGTTTFGGDGGPATDAEFDAPRGVAVDSAGEVVVNDSGNGRVRLVAAADCVSGCPYALAATTKGDVYTIAGNGTTGFFGGDGGRATAAALGGRDDLAVDGAGDLLISDSGNNRVRLVAAADCASGCPYGLAATTKGDIYTIVGDGNPVFSGDGGPATAAELNAPDGVALDGAGDLLINDSGNNRVRLVAAADCASGCPYGLAATTKGDIYTIAGNGTTGFGGDGGPASAAKLNSPGGVAVDSAGDVLISDQVNVRVRLVAAADCTSGCPYGLAATTKGDIYTIAGNGTSGFGGDGGPATAAKLSNLRSVAVDSAGNVLIGDRANERVRLVAAADCSSGCAYGLAATTKGNIYTIAGNGTSGFSGDGGAATTAELSTPDGIAADSAGDVLISDRDNNRIRLVAGGSAGGGGPTASPSAQHLDFGQTVVGLTSDSNTVTITNKGAAALEVSALQVTGAQASAFHVTGDDCSAHSVPPGNKCTISLTFSPLLTGPSTASLIVTDNASDSPQSVALTGTGVAPTPSITPNGLTFQPTLVGKSSAPQTVTVSNPGPSPLAVGTPQIIGSQAGGFHTAADTCSGHSVPAGGSCTVAVIFSSAVTGAYSASLQISDDAANSPQAIPLQGTAVAVPSFTAASPPLTIVVGGTVDYTFVATGYPAPTYALSPGAPSWLTIDPTSGRLTGTVPAGTTTFSYSVIATNSFGSQTAGPFFSATATPVSVSGTVKDSGGNPVAGAVVDACLAARGSPCYSTTSTSTGAFTVNALPGTSIVLTAYPPKATGDTPGRTAPIPVPADGLQGQLITVPGFAATLGNLTLPHLPLDWTRPEDTMLTGCSNGLATVTVTARDPATGLFDSNLVVLPETPLGSGVYAGVLPPQYPLHGPAEIQSSVSCPPHSALFPSLGPSSGGNTVIVTGSGFTGATAVDFGGVPASSYTVLSALGIKAVAPPGTGNVPVTVHGPGVPGGAVVVDQYTYQAVQSISPASGPPAGGTWVIITGTGLLSATSVHFGQTAANFITLSSTQLEALSPPGQGTQDITVDTLYGGTTPTTTADTFTYSAANNATTTRANLTSARSPVSLATARRSGRLTADGFTSGAASNVVKPRANLASVPVPALPATVRDAGPFSAALARAPLSAAASLGPAPSGSVVLDQILNFIYNEGPDIYQFFRDGKRNIHLALLGLNPTCATSQAVVADAVKALLRPYIETVVLEAIPFVRAAIALLLSESGPGAIPISFAVSPVATEILVNELVGSLINAAVASVFGDCKDTDPQLPEPPPPPKPPPPPPPPGGPGGTGAGPLVCQQPVEPTSCDGNFSPNVLIDPSGTVLDTNGNPVSGATATILRSDAWNGPFTPVDVAAPGIEPAVNPETTGTDGAFHWDVDSGFYEVQAAAPGCTAAGDDAQSTATAGPYPVPPPQVGLTITLACPNEPAAPVPSVTSLSENTGPPGGGTTVTMLGSGFTPSSRVMFGASASSTVTYLSPEALIAVSPPGQGPVNVVVQTAGGNSATSSADQFFYGSPPAITGLRPQSGPVTGGTTITISGTGFTGATAVGFGGLPATSFEVKSDSEIQATTPPEPAGTVDIAVVTPAGANAPTPADRYTYLAAAPQTITFTSTPPAHPVFGGSYRVTATGGGSGNPVVFSVDSSSTQGACSVSDSTVSFTGVGSCVIDANQAGNSEYSAAPQVHQSLSIAPAPPGPTLAVAKQGSGSGTVTSSPPGITCGSTCSHAYDIGTTVSLTAMPAPGSTFVGWSGGGCTGIGPCAVAMTADTTVTATFNRIPPGTPKLGHVGVVGTTASVLVSCMGRTGASCSVTLTLAVTETVKGRKVLAITAKTSKKPNKKTVVVGKATVTVAAGHRKTVRVALNPTGKRLLVRYHKLKVKLTITQSGKAITSRTVTFHLVPRAHGR